MPGPGHYDLNISSIKGFKSVSINPSPMVAGAVRFRDLKSNTPAPGDYEICDCPTEHKQFSIKDIPFGNQANRFHAKKDNGFPGTPLSSYFEKHARIMQYLICRTCNL